MLMKKKMLELVRQISFSFLYFFSLFLKEILFSFFFSLFFKESNRVKCYIISFSIFFYIFSSTLFKLRKVIFHIFFPFPKVFQESNIAYTFFYLYLIFFYFSRLFFKISTRKKN